MAVYFARSLKFQAFDLAHNHRTYLETHLEHSSVSRDLKKKYAMSSSCSGDIHNLFADFSQIDLFLGEHSNEGSESLFWDGSIDVSTPLPPFLFDEPAGGDRSCSAVLPHSFLNLTHSNSNCVDELQMLTSCDNLAIDSNKLCCTQERKQRSAFTLIPAGSYRINRYVQPSNLPVYYQFACEPRCSSDSVVPQSTRMQTDRFVKCGNSTASSSSTLEFHSIDDDCCHQFSSLKSMPITTANSPVFSLNQSETSSVPVTATTISFSKRTHTLNTVETTDTTIIQCHGTNSKSNTRCRSLAMMEFVGVRPRYTDMDEQAQHHKCNYQPAASTTGRRHVSCYFVCFCLI
jgi:hypothetical protein